MKVAFAIIPEKGHINPYIGPAQALMDAGHSVLVAAPGNIWDQMARAGLDFRTDLIDPRVSDADARVTRGAALVELIQDAARLREWIEQLLLADLPAGVDRIREWYTQEGFDVVVVDPLYYAAAIAAHVEGIPWVALSNSLNPVLPAALDSVLLQTVAALSSRRTKLFETCGFEKALFSGCDVLSPHLTIAFTTEEMVGPAPAGVTLVGPSWPLRNRGDEMPIRPLPPDEQVIYVSFGSQIYHWPDLFEKLAEVGKALGVHMVFSLGELVDDERWTTPREHCDVYRYAPQAELLKGAAAFVTHGGANSMMEAIVAGVPMLLCPMCNDQFHQAYFVQQAGIGYVENLQDAPVERITERLAGLLSDEKVRSRMDSVSQSYQLNGAVRAAQLIADLAVK
jgi:zeaxanthin glucosyltransferase